MRKQVSFCLLSLLSLLMAACHSQRAALPQPEPVVLRNAEQVRTEYVETLRIDTVTVLVEIPAQSARSVTNDTVSVLETDYALSRACWKDGLLSHWLVNKARKVSIAAPVVGKETHARETAVKVKEVPVPAPYAVEVPRDFTTWERIRLATWWYVVGALGLSLLWMLRKPLLAALRNALR